MSFAAFVLSTGRCGTQWLAQSIAEVYSDCIRVEHEPLDDRYNPREALGVSIDGFVGTENFPMVVRQHLEEIAGGIEKMPYLECGHPCWSSIPRIAAALGDSVRIVHLIRHPVPTAMSWVTHRAYQAPVLPMLPEKNLLSPFDKGVLIAGFQERWKCLTPFEKCLYYWLEVHAFALRMQSQASVPWLTLKYEDLFSGDGLSSLIEFLELPPRPGVFSQGQQVVDRYRYLSAIPMDHLLVEKHPEIMDMMKKFGYNLDELDCDLLSRRYTVMGAHQANELGPIMPDLEGGIQSG